MADDVNPELRAELDAANDKLDPQIRGLHDLKTVSISDPLKQELDRQIAIRERRRGFIKAVLDHLDGAREAMAILERDGYPNIEDTKLDNNLLAELSGEVSDLEAAAGIFKTDAAQDLSVRLGSPTDKSKTNSKE